MDLPGEGQKKAPPREGLPLLVFKVAGWRLGVAVDQVEALTGLPPLPPADEPVTGAAAGAAACTYQGRVLTAHPLSAWLGLEDDAGWQPSRLLIVRGPEYPSSSGDALRAFLVDAPRGILTLPLDAVYAMPLLVARALGPSPFWGVAYDRNEDDLVLLLDLGADAARSANMARAAEAIPGTGRG